MRRDERCAFLSGSVHIDCDFLSMPVKLFRRVCIVINVDGDLAAVFEAKQRPWKLPVVGNSGDNPLGSDLDGRSLDTQRVVHTCLVLRHREESGKWKFNARTGKLYACNRTCAGQKSAAGNAKGA